MVKASLSVAQTGQGPDLWTGQRRGYAGCDSGSGPLEPIWEVTSPSHSGERRGLR